MKPTTVKYRGKAENGATIEMKNMIFHEATTFKVELVSDEFVLLDFSENTVKFSLLIEDWPFESEKNTLHFCSKYNLNKPLHKKGCGDDEKQYQTVQKKRVLETIYHSNNGFLYFPSFLLLFSFFLLIFLLLKNKTKQKNKDELKVSEMKVAVIDEKRIQENILHKSRERSEYVFPYFSKSLNYDPSVGLLLGGGSDGGNNNNCKEQQDIYFYLSISLIIAITIISAIIMFIFRKTAYSKDKKDINDAVKIEQLKNQQQQQPSNNILKN